MVICFFRCCLHLRRCWLSMIRWLRSSGLHFCGIDELVYAWAATAFHGQAASLMAMALEEHDIRALYDDSLSDDLYRDERRVYMNTAATNFAST